MKTVVLAWELGAGLGHVMRAAALAHALARAGVRVVVAMPDLADAARVRWPEGVAILCAPQARHLPDGFFNQSTYAELLYGCGYHDANQVSGLVTGWFNLLDLCDADAILADHAPSAHLAARILGIPAARIGSGFFAPPAQGPAPRFRDWQATDAQRAVRIERHVLEVVNGVRTLSGVAPCGELCLALAPQLDLIASWPELDCYAALRSANSVVYIGNEVVTGQGLVPQWPTADDPSRKRVAAYLKSDYGGTRTILGELERHYSTVAFVAGLGSSERASLQSANLWIADAPIDIGAAASQCAILVSHAGAGTAPAFLAAGKPVLLLPYSAEQRMNATSIAATGAGRWLAEEDLASRFPAELSELVEHAGVRARAADLAARWAGRPDAFGAAVRQIMGLINSN